ncbi:MAG: TlpA family protein disulfide reductase [Mogibacterium sp.]|nr:TlpA family protein disulfide reductase [Mogibacterium sp.]
MKKYLILILSLVLCLSISACASNEPAEEEYEEDEYHYAAEDIEVGTGIAAFESEDMDGNKVTEAVFADKDVTVLNVWATFCGPCIGEMPDLAAWDSELPDNVQIVGVVIDTPPSDGNSDEIWGGAAENLELAHEICDKTGVKYLNILASESVMKAFAVVEAVPTTFILDREGKTICPPIIGADVNSYKKAVEDYLAG